MTKQPKTKYRATFTDGTVVTRNSYREYTHAWRCGGMTGFSGSERLAQDQCRGYMKWQPEATTEVVKVEVLP